MEKKSNVDETAEVNRKISRPSEDPSPKKQKTLRVDVLPSVLGANTSANPQRGETEKALRRATEKRGS